MALELNKRNYKKQEVSDIIAELKAQYENLIDEQKTKLNEISKENASLKQENEDYKAKEKLIIATLERAEKNAMELDERVKFQYALEVQKLQSFMDKMSDYFDEMQEKYPLYPITKQVLTVRDMVEKSTDAVDTIKEIDEILFKHGKGFNPKQKIKEYIATTKNSGFNLDDVLNPGELVLEELCKELGLIEEKE